MVVTVCCYMYHFNGLREGVTLSVTKIWAKLHLWAYKTICMCALKEISVTAVSNIPEI